VKEGVVAWTSSQKSLFERAKSKGKKYEKMPKNILGDFHHRSVADSGPVGTVIPGWTVVGTSGVNVDQAPTAPPNPEYWPGNPSQFLDLTGNTGGGGILSAPFATTVGQTYVITFENFNGSEVYPGIDYLRSDFSLQASGGALYTWSGLTPGTTRNLTYTFTAGATTSTLTFMDTSGFDSNAGWIDNVGISAAVPEPTTMVAGAMLLLPFGFSTLRMLRKTRTA
jgi:hypothetical protein